MSDDVEAKIKELEEEVYKFNTLSLPGQMPAMHMGTSYLVNDLWAMVRELKNKRFTQNNG